MPLTPVPMAYTAEEKRMMGKPMTEGRAPEEMEDYPYSLCLYLSTAELRKLGFARGQLMPGDKVTLAGTGMVKSARAEMVNGLEAYSADVQIHSLAIDKNEEEDKKADTIYGGKS